LVYFPGVHSTPFLTAPGGAEPVTSGGIGPAIVGALTSPEGAQLHSMHGAGRAHVQTRPQPARIARPFCQLVAESPTSRPQVLAVAPPPP
jgi:hypothetical protein